MIMNYDKGSVKKATYTQGLLELQDVTLFLMVKLAEADFWLTILTTKS